ncbi:MAG: phosphate propanoyltransferase [Lachnospiraceae bacterium]|nr:phosphate propanoyltransferase [Lachnospiraceae bacterium]
MGAWEREDEVELITRLVMEALEGSKDSEKKMTVPIGVSARHIHLSQEDVEKLFGPGYQLTKKKDLMGGQFAANEQCTIVGLKLRAIENVRILGPVRKQSQVEISATDARTLGVNAPLRESGDLKGSAAIALVGPKGVIYLDEGCIVAARHIHMTPSEAEAVSLKDGDYVTVRMGDERGAVLDNVKIRVDESFDLEMHIDTDEANACQVKQGDIATILRKSNQP